MSDSEPRLLMTLHLPLDMRLVGEILHEVARVHPDAVFGQNGTVWSSSPPAESDVTGKVTVHFGEPR